MNVLTLFPQYLSTDESYGHYAYNESMLADDCDFFNIFNLFSISVKNNNLNFDEFITNCKVISHASNSDK